MEWVVGIIIFLLLVGSEGFRNLLGSFILLIVIFVSVKHSDEQNEEKERKQSILKIKLSEVAMENMRLIPPGVGSAYKLTGRIQNNSTKHSLKEVTLRVTIQDCSDVPAKNNCVTIGEESATTRIAIPPGQARDYDQVVMFSDCCHQITGHMTWNYAITGILAD